jgi:hypothetical protein
MTNEEVGFIGLGTMGLPMVTKGRVPADPVERLRRERPSGQTGVFAKR